jgi:hypothetical protein
LETHVRPEEELFLLVFIGLSAFPCWVLFGFLRWTPSFGHGFLPATS